MTQDDEIQEIVRTTPAAPRPATQKFFVVLLCLIAAVPACLALGNTLYDRFFEGSPPIIHIVSVPEGLGSSPTTLQFTITDEGSGIDEYVVRLQGRIGQPREIIKRKVSGESYIEENLTLGGAGSGLDQGVITLTIRAFDRSMWSNASEQVITLKVDYSRPRAHIITSMHNARIGGSQLAFYRIKGDDVAASGVKVGDTFFFGYPAKGLDPAFSDPSLFVVIYGLDLRTVKTDTPVRVFSQNSVRNTSLGTFYNRVASRTTRLLSVNASTPQIEPLVKDDLAALSTPSLTTARWTLPFLPPKGTITVNFGDERVFKLKGQVVGRDVSVGYEFRTSPSDRTVVVANDGVISRVIPSSKRGTIIAVDHGLGLVSVYDRLTEVRVKEGDKVTRGQELALASLSESGRNGEVYYEVRVQSVPVDAREWWETRWCQDHIVKKIAEIKKQLVIAAAQEG